MQSQSIWWLFYLGMPMLVYPRAASTLQSQFVNQNSLLEQSSQALDLQPQFESPEHASIGDQVLLKYPDSSVVGLKFDYKVNNVNLSFGDIVALAGDFYAQWGWNPFDCPPSISDDWDKNRNNSIAIAEENVDRLRTDSLKRLDVIQPLIRLQADDILKAKKNGKDIAQAYKSIEWDYDKLFGVVAFPAYEGIAFCNEDHFGNDAKKAYSAVHTLALRQAQTAFKTQKQSDLKEAYFIEGYAQHYLTDMFAAGHLRTPRRLLHSTSAPLNPTKLFGGDQCCRAQHAEDGANGLWVTNEEGTSWAVYGDKQLNQGRSGKNRQMVSAASQAGVDEVWETFQSGKMIEATEFKALRKTPIPEKTTGITNSVPLFERNPSNPKQMFFRQNIDQRAVAGSRSAINDMPNNDEWAIYLNAITGSGSSKNMYVYSRSFSSDQRFLHLGRVESGSSDLVTNLYGPVDASDFGQYWGMAAQGIGKLEASEKKRLWTNAQSINSGVVSLVGREYTSGARTSALHVGYGFLATLDGQLRPRVLWSQKIDDGNSDRTPGEVIYGSFSQDSSKHIMVKYFEGSKSDSRMEFWSLPVKLDSPPFQFASALNIAKLNFLVSHKIDQEDSFSTIVGYQSGPLSISTGTWYFCSWTSDYGEMRLTTISEPNSNPAQALVSDPLSNRLVRVYYGKRYPNVKTIRVDVLLLRRNDSDGSIAFQDEPGNQKFTVSWDALNEEDYLLWFMHDVNGNGRADLVTYTSDASNMKLNVVVFPSREDGKFDPPIVSNIELDADFGNLLTAEFMQPLHTAQTTYTYPITGDRSEGAIMSFFNNYGIIATRIVAPKASTGTYRYELVGQDSAISGQRSSTLGERPKGWMGLGRNTQRVGIIPL